MCLGAQRVYTYMFSVISCSASRTPCVHQKIVRDRARYNSRCRLRTMVVQMHNTCLRTHEWTQQYTKRMGCAPEVLMCNLI